MKTNLKFGRALALVAATAALLVSGVVTSQPARAEAVSGCVLSGGYGIDVVPVAAGVARYDLFAVSYGAPPRCTAAQVTVTAVPADGTPLTCELYIPYPVAANGTSCSAPLTEQGIVLAGTSVRLVLDVVSVGQTAASVNTTYQCTVVAAGDPRCSF